MNVLRHLEATSASSSARYLAQRLLDGLLREAAGPAREAGEKAGEALGQGLEHGRNPAVYGLFGPGQFDEVSGRVGLGGSGTSAIPPSLAKASPDSGPPTPSRCRSSRLPAPDRAGSTIVRDKRAAPVAEDRPQQRPPPPPPPPPRTGGSPRATPAASARPAGRARPRPPETGTPTRRRSAPRRPRRRYGTGAIGSSVPGSRRR